MRISDWSSDVCSSDLRDFVDRGQYVPLAADRRDVPRQGVDQIGARGGDTVEQPLDTKLVHQKADRAPVHPENGQAAALVEQLMQHVQQEPVAAERDQEVGLGQIDEVVERAKLDRKSTRLNSSH